MESASRYKESGNKFFSMNNYSAAAACYRLGIEELRSSSLSTSTPSDGGSADQKDTPTTNGSSKDDECRTMEVALRGNLALMLLKISAEEDAPTARGNLDECIKECSLALELDPNNAKILYRRGQAYQRLAGEVDEVGSSAAVLQSFQKSLLCQAEDDFVKCIRILEMQMTCQRKSRLTEDMRSTAKQIKDATKSLEKLRMAKKNGANHPKADEPPSLSSPPQTTTKSSGQTGNEEFPWHVPILLQNASPPEPLPMGGSIIRSALSPPQQRLLYEMLRDNVDESSEEYKGLRMTDTIATHRRHNQDNRPQPLVTWVHPYTRLSNAVERPTRLMKWAEEIMHALAPESKDHEVDSMLAQLYALGGNLLKHRDEDLSWGIGVSLGSCAEFDCLPEDDGENKRVTIRSGDIIVGDFGKMLHAVSVPERDNDPPSWWGDVDHFGSKMRCNVLFRKALTAKRQRKLAEERARKVYGISLGELKQRTGKDDSYLSVHLRHLALE